jgi:hypothetical protein
MDHGPASLCLTGSTLHAAEPSAVLGRVLPYRAPSHQRTQRKDAGGRGRESRSQRHPNVLRSQRPPQPLFLGPLTRLSLHLAQPRPPLANTPGARRHPSFPRALTPSSPSRALRARHVLQEATTSTPGRKTANFPGSRHPVASIAQAPVCDPPLARV